MAEAKTVKSENIREEMAELEHNQWMKGEGDGDRSKQTKR